MSASSPPPPERYPRPVPWGRFGGAVLAVAVATAVHAFVAWVTAKL